MFKEFKGKGWVFFWMVVVVVLGESREGKRYVSGICYVIFFGSGVGRMGIIWREEFYRSYVEGVDESIGFCCYY